MFDFINHFLEKHFIIKPNIISDEEFIIKDINRFMVSMRRRYMLEGERYFDGKHDILIKKRMVIGKDGELEEIKNLPNNRIVDNQYKKMVVQKCNYLLGQPLTIQCENNTYSKLLKKILNKKFMRTLKSVGEDSLNCGIGWLFLYYDDNGEFSFRRFKPFEIIPGWSNAEHTSLDYFIRLYDVILYEGKEEKIITKVEVYDKKGINYFTLESGKLVPDEKMFRNYFTIIDSQGKEQGYNWSKIPLIPFKYNSKEIPLINMVKSIQDGINTIESNFQNNMEEDSRNTILVLVNYDGQNLGEFRHNLSTYGAVKVRNDSNGSGGDVKTLQVEVNAENYKAILELFKKALIENAMGYDAKDDRLQGNANQMNIQSMYSDIDLDANNMETEYQAAFEDILWFINCHLANTGLGDFENEEVEVIFNRDMMINETEVIENCSKSIGVLSDETILANHPWIDDPQAELKRIKKSQEEEYKKTDMYGSTFNKGGENDGKDSKENKEDL